MSNIGRIRTAILSSVLGLGAVLTSPATLAADDWPNKPIEVIVPYTPGGSTDTVARFVMKELEERLGQTIIIQNRPGALRALSSQRDRKSTRLNSSHVASSYAVFS